MLQSLIRGVLNHPISLFRLIPVLISFFFMILYLLAYFCLLFKIEIWLVLTIWKNERFENVSSWLFQKNNLQDWKDSVSYGQRWIAETVFSCIKRMFGEYVYSVKPKNMIQKKWCWKRHCIIRASQNYLSINNNTAW